MEKYTTLLQLIGELVIILHIYVAKKLWSSHVTFSPVNLRGGFLKENRGFSLKKLSPPKLTGKKVTLKYGFDWNSESVKLIISLSLMLIVYWYNKNFDIEKLTMNTLALLGREIWTFLPPHFEHVLQTINVIFESFTTLTRNPLLFSTVLIFTSFWQNFSMVDHF